MVRGTTHFFFVELTNTFFVKYGSKRLESVAKVMTSSSLVDCAVGCMEMDGCYAVNFNNKNRGNCELTSEVSYMVDDVMTDLYIAG